MRIHQVSMTGFGPFRHTQTVDLDAFGDHGIFLITGRTGAGKSSILDAIVYALYDSAPRYGSGGGKQVRSSHCSPDEPSRVELVFSSGDQTYRIVRTPEYERPKSRGTGFTREKATAELARLDGDQWVGIASQLRTVGEELHTIVPLSCDQFLQVVLLAQGQFQRFLVASSDERQQLLRTLFRSDRFSAYDIELQRRAGALRQELRLVESGIASTVTALAEHAGREIPDEADEAWISAVLEAHDADVDLARADLEQADKELLAAQELVAQVTGLAERQRRFAEASSVMARLVAQQASIDADRIRRDLGLAAQAVRVHHARVTSSQTVAQQAVAALESAGARFVDVVEGPPPPDLPAHRDALAAQLAVLRERLADEQELERLRVETRSLARELQLADQRTQDLVDQSSEHRTVLESPVPLTSDRAQADLDALRDELVRARRRTKTEAELVEAQVEELSCRRTHATASAGLVALQERRLAEYAGTLAQTLVEGQGCAVCGSVDHPEPALLGADPVTEAMLEAATDALDEADRCARAAADRVLALRTTLEAWAEVRPVEELTETVALAEQALLVALEDEQRRADALAAQELIEAERKALDVRRAKLEQRAESVDEQMTRLNATIEQARGTAGSVVERMAVVEAHLSAATTLIDARTAADAARERLAECGEAFEAALAHHGFDDEANFSSARLDDEALAALDRRVLAHDRTLVEVEATLKAPELSDLPVEPVDVDGPRLALTQARAAHGEATKHYGAVEKCATTSHQLATSIRRAWAQNATARASYVVLDRLARSLHGESPNTRRMRVESYVLAAELEQIVAAANVRLRAMTSGRYALQRSDVAATRGSNSGLEVRVRDEYTSVTRTPESLSGGEKFLASLALALGLAEVVTNRAGGITLDTLFIDEGFGSLDAETLDVAMHTLDALRQNGRTIGLISHVETMKERIPAQLGVTKTADGWSRVEIRA